MKKFFLIIFTLFIIGILFYLFSHYTMEINLNWDINIPIEDKLIYYEDGKDEDDINFHGDGRNYVVLEYNDERKIEKLSKINWISGKNKEVEIKALEVIEAIEVDNQYIIDFTKDYQYFYKEINKTNFIIIFYHKENNIVYIVEQKT